MPTVIEGLILTLGLDATAAEKGAGRLKTALKDTSATSATTGKTLDDTAKKGALGFSTLSASALGFLSIIGIGAASAVKNFTENLISSGAPLDRLAANLNMGVPALSALSNAAEIAGDSADGLKSALISLNAAQNELDITGSTNIQNALNMIHTSLKDSAGKAKPLNELLLEISKNVKETFPDNKAKQFDVINRLGLGGALNFMQKTRGEQDRLIGGQLQFGAMSQKQADAAEKAAEKIAELKTKFNALGNDIGVKFLPLLESMITRMENIIKIVDKWAVNPEKLISNIKAGVTNVAEQITAGGGNDMERVKNIDAVGSTADLLTSATSSFFSFESDEQRNRFLNFLQRAKSILTPDATMQQSTDQYGNPSAPVDIEQLRRNMAPALKPSDGAQISSPQTNNSVSINEVKIYTNAKDAGGIAKDFRSAMSNLMIAQANSGMV